MNVNEELADGTWRPSVPLPFIGTGFLRCHCGRFFIGGWRRARRRYERHYRRAHLAAKP